LIGGAVGLVLAGFVFLERSNSTGDSAAHADSAAADPANADTVSKEAVIPGLDDVDASIAGTDAAASEADQAAQLRSRAKEIKLSVAELDGQRRRGARAWIDSPDELNKRLEELEGERRDLEARADELDRQAAEQHAAQSVTPRDQLEMQQLHENEHDATAGLNDDDVDLDDDDDTGLD
jgi:hypothetical protein